MSLENTYQKLRTMNEQLPIWKLMSMCIGVAIITTGISIFFNPTILSQVENLAVKTFLVGILTMSFTAVYLTLFVGGLVCGMSIIGILLKSRDSLYVKNGIFAGHSLATNHEFLRKLAQGLYQYLIEFIRGYNDPRLKELEEKHDREKNELRKEIQEIKTDYSRAFKIQNIKYEQSERRRISAEGYLKLEREKNQRLELENQELERKYNHKTQKIGDKFRTNNNSENTKVDKGNKFEEDL